MQEIFEELERQKHALVESVMPWPAARLALRPAPEQWSAVEVLDHLERTERSILATARRGLREPHATGVRDRLGFLFLDRVFRSERRVKVPASAAAVLPGTDLEFAEVLDRWRETREQLEPLLPTITPVAARYGVFRHPVGGWMTFPQVLQFFSAHMIHHQFQLKRNLATLEGKRADR